MSLLCLVAVYLVILDTLAMIIPHLVCTMVLAGNWLNYYFNTHIYNQLMFVSTTRVVVSNISRGLGII
jgi:hypothetical protein